MGGVFDYDTVPGNNGTTINSINVAEFCPPANLNNAIRQMAADFAMYMLDTGGANTTGGTSDALTLDTSGTIDSNRNGIVLAFQAHAGANAGATLNVDSEGAKEIRKLGDEAIVSGDIVADGVYIVMYRDDGDGGSGAWMLLNPSSARADDLTGTLPDGVFPSTLPAASGENLTSLDATQLTGTLADARLSNNVPLLDAASNDFDNDLGVGGDITVGGSISMTTSGALLIGSGHGASTDSAGTAIGKGAQALAANVTATGLNAANGSTSASVTATGRDAARENSGNNVTATGVSAARDNEGNEVTATGIDAGRSNTGDNLTAAGRDAANGNTGDNVTATGSFAALNNTGNEVTATGFNAANGNTGADVTAMGRNAAQNNTGDNATAAGRGAANGNSGDNVIAMGVTAAQNNTGANATAMGVSAANGNTGDNCVMLGYQAGLNNSTANQFIVRQQPVNTTPLIQGDFSSGDIEIPGVFTADLLQVTDYTVSTLPSGAEAQIAYVSDGRKNGEGAGSGTGVAVFYDGSNWIAMDSGQTVAA